MDGNINEWAFLCLENAMEWSRRVSMRWSQAYVKTLRWFLLLDDFHQQENYYFFFQNYDVLKCNIEAKFWELIWKTLPPQPVAEKQTPNGFFYRRNHKKSSINVAKPTHQWCRQRQEDTRAAFYIVCFSVVLTVEGCIYLHHKVVRSLPAIPAFSSHPSGKQPHLLKRGIFKAFP